MANTFTFIEPNLGIATSKVIHASYRLHPNVTNEPESDWRSRKFKPKPSNLATELPLHPKVGQ